MIRHTNNKFVIKSSPILLGIGAVGTFMGIQGIRLLCGLLPLDINYDVSDIIGIVFASVWTFLVIGMALYGFITGLRKQTLCDDGIYCDVLFIRKRIPWCDIKDWGFSYCGRDRFANNMYYLYFSKNLMPTKNIYRKKLHGKVAKIIISDDDYRKALDDIVPFCSAKTDVAPFLAQDTVHFI